METRKNITGIGCYADPNTLARVLRRSMEAYLMAPLASIEALDGALSRQNRGSRWLRHLISGQPASDTGAPDECLTAGAISGFFLGVRPSGLTLSIFTGGRGSRRRHRTVRLDEVMALRRKRLN
jgi:hypothetical protein